MGRIYKKIVVLIKSIKIFYKLYYYIGSLLVNILKIFVRTQDNLILFVSYGGKQYSDSPKVIYEAMCKDPRYEQYEFVWAFLNPKAFSVPGNAKVIKIDSILYYLTSLKARCWITNVVIERGLKYRGKNTYYFSTWHGTPIKKVGVDAIGKSFNANWEYQYDAICVQGEYDAQIYERVFGLNKGDVLICGLARNDILSTADVSDQLKIKEKISIPADKKIILYAPTYRDGTGYVMDIPVNFKKWQEILGDEYVLFFRAHSAVIKTINADLESSFYYNMSDYPDLNELMIASDMLISDYSSIFFDYSILGKPMYCFTYDYDEYCIKRGVYFDIRNELPGGSISEDELLFLIKNTPYEEAVKRTKTFRDKYVMSYGNSTKRSLDIIYKNIHK